MSACTSVLAKDDGSESLCAVAAALGPWTFTAVMTRSDGRLSHCGSFLWLLLLFLFHFSLFFGLL